MEKQLIIVIAVFSVLALILLFTLGRELNKRLKKRSDDEDSTTPEWLVNHKKYIRSKKWQ